MAYIRKRERVSVRTKEREITAQHRLAPLHHMPCTKLGG
jgi:hypothetical protein